MTKNTDMTGVLVINKPEGKTSHDIVSHVRKTLQAKQRGIKLGHGGTLDPFATGVLLILIGKATRLMEYVNDLQKTYTATITLGATSDTDDSTGTITRTSSKQPSTQDITKILKTFIGTTQQIPPSYAAIKVKGEKLYDYARRGEKPPKTPRNVHIYDIQLMEYQYPNLTIRVSCASGTYIRALARDIGEMLETGAYTQSLHRNAIGPYTTQTAITAEQATEPSIREHIRAPKTLVNHLERVTVTQDNVAKLRQGKAVQDTYYTTLPQNTPIAVFDDDNRLIGIAHADPSAALLHPTKIL